MAKLPTWLRSVRLRILSLLLPGLFACFAAVIGMQSFFEFNSAVHMARRASMDQTWHLAHMARPLFETGTTSEFQAVFDDLVENQENRQDVPADLRFLQLILPDMDVRETFGSEDPITFDITRMDPVIRTALQGSTAGAIEVGNYHVMAVPVRAQNGGPAIGAVMAVWDTQGLQSELLGEIFNQAMLALGLALAMVALLLVILNRMIVAPIQCLAQSMLDMRGSRDRDIPSDLLTRKDEIGFLSRAFSGLIDEVESAQQELITNSELEIAERNRRLDAALTNMIVGLCMFDSENRLLVSNRRFHEIYAVDPADMPEGTPIETVFSLMKEAGNYPDVDLSDIMRRITAPVASRDNSHWIETIRGNRVVSAHQSPMPRGGWVLTFTDITEQRLAEARIEHLAHHDNLTGLPNRITFRATLDRELARVERGAKLAVLCLDLDRFKAVNDTLGHPVGDGLLQEVSKRILACVRKNDLVARLGGDEFAIIQEVDTDDDLPSSLAERIIGALKCPFEIQGHQIVIGSSIGIALAPGDTTDADELVKAADMALYRAKADGRGVFRFFEVAMDELMQERRRLEIDLRRALANGEFRVRYQPIVNVSSGDFACCEALLRWTHPERGEIPPADFIPLAEEIGLIPEIGGLVLRQACHDASNWPRNVRVAVNLSPVQFSTSGLVEEVEGALKASGLEPHRLELEITETVLLNQTDETLQILNQLRDFGVRIAMDDFGTGYSSLAYLRKFPFDKIKIDQSFIRDLHGNVDAQAIVRAIVSLGGTLGMSTTAEGVETLNQLEHLELEGCTEVQGWLFSRAVSTEEISSLLLEAPKASDVA
ncbi:putative bifunctional diguanylate cyclase/phosphodiesterase [Amaricoccus macauensis]|uniref:putative bifunctional diguanylate cyclase/phosphodiesterase n=1 Tax=Amaricoccus macauensis TaxID=57001 RepID=UPI003C7CE28E